MAIYINNVASKSVPSTERTVYKDVHLDLQENALPEINSLYAKVTQTDLRADVDEGAILNSIRNIFLTTPGEKVLNPTFGVNLLQWLFEPMTEITSREIGEAIVEGIERFEPRVVVNNVTVVANYKLNQYNIKLALMIPQLNIKNNYLAVLGPGFNFLTENE